MDKVTTTQPDRVTQAEFARMCSVSRKTITTWKASRLVVMDGDQVNVPESMAKLKMYRDKHDGRAARGEHAKRTPTLAPPVHPSQFKPLTRRELVDRLKHLDWTTTFAPKTLATRLEQAAKCVGFVLVTSPLRDDGHWGGYQVRSVRLLQHHGGLCFDAVIAGYGFELDAFDVLEVCRKHIWHPDDGEFDMDDVMDDVLPDLLPALAWPFGEVHQPRD